MVYLRRSFLSNILAGTVIPAIEASAQSSPQRSATGRYRDLQDEIAELFTRLPGRKAVKFLAPATYNGREFRFDMNSSERLFVGSAIKAFVLCERLRQLDGPDIVQKLTEKQLDLNASVWSADSQTFNPPNLAGKVTERTTMEAMILHSDNTATDMELAQAGPGRVRAFLSSAGLNQSNVPDSTRVFFGYLLGAPNYKTFSWADLLAATNSKIVNPPLNNMETLASSADDFVSFYSRGLRGEFFKHQETLDEFRRILSLGDVISIVPFPQGASAFAKGGASMCQDFTLSMPALCSSQSLGIFPELGRGG
ncbi:MAG: serine hydrolase [Bryobacteraceae bacterium]